ncbi:acyl-[acyl-carrier-protein] thioesterase [Algoriphagus sp. AK58]|uniref:acyl-[acyl-carrier-protein] thioesterase n=1 Tax=Algoriphagus sp. AK58 TaxID=1406877 RepID=UPI00165087ED|nr:acyl-ACP thioesterase domain-containing protein [Algoriphagus sp. AK58]MBC6368667.1 acyl-ACP thioesterase [Algoriphagus sp. AK58]
MRLPEDFQFTKQFEVGSFQVHPDGKIKLSSLADLLQEIAWRHADSGDFGRNLLENKQMWVLSRLEIRVFEFPKWGDTIQIFTGGRGAEKLFAFREFMVWDENKRVLARAMSSWLLLHSETKRIQKPESVLPHVLFDPSKAPSWQPEKLSIHGLLGHREELKVRHSDLDLYNHVNNTSYIRWSEDFFADLNIFPSAISINYLSECLAGDKIELSGYEEDGRRFLEGKVGSKAVFLVKIG